MLYVLTSSKFWQFYESKSQNSVMTSTMTHQMTSSMLHIAYTLSFPFNTQIVCKTSQKLYTRNFNLHIHKNRWFASASEKQANDVTSSCLCTIFPKFQKWANNNKLKMRVTPAQKVNCFFCVIKTGREHIFPAPHA